MSSHFQLPQSLYQSFGDCTVCTIFIIIIIILKNFHISSDWYFHWSTSDSKCPQLSRTLLSILASLCRVVVWMVSIFLQVSSSSSFFFWSSRISNYDWYHCHLHFLYQSLGDSKGPRVSRTLLSILADLNYDSSSDLQLPDLFSGLLGTISRALPSIGITITLTVFQLSGHIQVFDYHSTCFYFHSVVRWKVKIYEMTSFIHVY